MKKIAIVSALGREIKYIKENMEITKTHEIKGYRFSEGFYKDLQIVLGITSVGKVNAAICSEILINNFNPDAVINTGIAGALTDKTEVFDVVIAENLVYHDVEEYILIGCYPFTAKFTSDKTLFKKALEVAGNWKKENNIHWGKMISGDSFVSSKNQKDKLVDLHHPLCVEMEGAAIAHVCHINNIPFIAFRGISDNADDSARELYKKNEIPAANEAGKFVLNFLELIQKSMGCHL